MVLRTIDDWVNAAKAITESCTTPAGNSWHMNWGITQHQYQLMMLGHCTHCNRNRKDIS